MSQNPVLDYAIPGVIYTNRPQSEWAKYKNSDKVPVGMVPLFSSLSGKTDIIGYADKNSSAVVLFPDADPKTARRVEDYAKKNSMSTSKESGSGYTLYSVAPQPQQGQAQQQATPNAAAPSGAAASDSTLGSYGAGASTASGPLSASTSLGSQPGDYDTSKLKVTVKDNSGAWGDDFLNATINPVAPTQSTIQAQVNNVFGMTPDQRAELTKKLTDAGYGPNDTTLFSLARAYEGALLDLNRMENVPDVTGLSQNLSVDEFLDQQAKANAAGGSATKTVTSTDTQVSDAQTAESILTTSFKNSLGRKPTPQELTAFTAALQEYQRANPSVKTTTGSTQTLNGQTAGNTSSTTTGGTTAAGIDQFAKSYVTQNFGQEESGDRLGGAFDLFLQTIGAGAGAGSA